MFIPIAKCFLPTAIPDLNQYPHLAGNFGTAWQSQQKEFQNIPAPVLFTTNCLMPPRAQLRRPRLHDLRRWLRGTDAYRS